MKNKRGVKVKVFGSLTLINTFTKLKRYFEFDKMKYFHMIKFDNIELHNLILCGKSIFKRISKRVERRFVVVVRWLKCSKGNLCLWILSNKNKVYI